MVATAFRLVTVVVVVLAATPAFAGGVGDASRADAPDCPDDGDFCASFADEAVGVSDWPYRTNLTVTGDVSAVEITAEGLSASQLADVFGGERTGDGVRVEVGDDGAIPAEFEYSGGGNYTFHVRAVGTNRTAVAHLLVTVGEAPTVYFSPEFPTVEFGRTAEIGLEFEDSTVGNVTVAGEGFRLNATVRDDDGDGSAALLLDSDALGNGTEAITVAGADRLLTANVSAANATLSAGTYELSAGLDGRETAVGLLEVVHRVETIEATTGPESTEVESTGEPTEDADVPTAGVDTSEGAGSPQGTEPREESTRGVPGFGVGSALAALALAFALARLRR